MSPDQPGRDLAHEINNPLAVLVAALHLLPRLRQEPQKFEACIASMDQACQRIAKIVASLQKPQV